MSFRCEECNQVQGSGIRPNMIVVGIKERKYSNRGSFSFGSEITKEKKMCDGCVPDTPAKVRSIEGGAYVNCSPLTHRIQTGIAPLDQIASEGLPLNKLT